MPPRRTAAATMDLQLDAQLKQHYAKARNGGDVKVSPDNLALRATTFDQIQENLVLECALHTVKSPACIPGNADADEKTLKAGRLSEAPQYKLDPNWEPQSDKPADWSNQDMAQELLRMAAETSKIPRSKQSMVYARERFGTRELIYDMYFAPFVFPWSSKLLPAVPSARKLYVRCLDPEFRFYLPGMKGAAMDRARYFKLIFEDILPSFPDLNFDIKFDPATKPTGDDIIQYSMQVSGTHTGASFGIGSLNKIEAKGAKVCLNLEAISCKVDDLKLHEIKSNIDDVTAFPTGLYLQVGGDASFSHLMQVLT